MNDNGPIEQIKELAPQAGLEVKLAIESHNAAVFGRRIVELEALLRKAVEAFDVLSDYENLDTSGGYYDGGATIFSYEARKRYGDFDDVARTTLEILKEQSK